MVAVQILITMSTREIDRLEVVKRVLERRITRVKAAALMGLNERQVRRMCAAYEAEGAAGLVSRRRGKPSNNRTQDGFREQAMALIRERYSDFGPTLATEKLGRVAWPADFPRDGAALDEGCRALAFAQSASPEASPASGASCLPGRADPDRRITARLVRGARSRLFAAGVR
jgi:hypothetical protein